MARIRLRTQWQRLVRAANRSQDQKTPLYRPLDTDRNEIRLVTLSPGHFEDDIHCILSNVPLNEKPPYEALSYVWGTGSHRQIFIDGRPSLITSNLEVALRYLRHTSQPRVMWIDAICINQGDIPERNTQVMHMGDVYSGASRVIAWLGEEDEDSKLAFDALEALPGDAQSHWDFRQNTSLDKKFLEPKYAAAINSLFCRPWWHRIWTVQESLLGPILDFVCGHRMISADVLCAFSTNHTKHSVTCCRGFFWKEADHFTRQSLPVAKNVLDGLEWRRNGHRRHLADLLMAFRSRLCTDPRDKIYGLLGLCVVDERKTIHPDYSIPVSLAYEQITLKIIENSRTLDVFSQLCSRSSQGFELRTGHLPSWAPNWTLDLSLVQCNVFRIRQERNDFYNASSGTYASVIYLEQGRIALKGILLGPVAIIGTPGPSDGYHVKSTLTQWRDMAGIETLPNRPYGSRTSITVYDAFWQTLCCSILLPRSSLHDADQIMRTSDNTLYRPWHDAWWNWFSKYDGDEAKIDSLTSDYTGSEINLFDVSVIAATSMRSLFISRDEERLGLAPMDAKVGDIIALLEGGSVPYILRPRSGTEAGCYELIGDAYVHGIMDGEEWKPEFAQEIILV